MNTKNKKLKIAIAGLGFGKKVHLEALKESDHFNSCSNLSLRERAKIDYRKRNGLRFFS